MVNPILQSSDSNWQKNDNAIQDAKEDLIVFFEDEENKKNVFYSRQIEVIFEGVYFHWITNAALNQLSQEGFLKKERIHVKENSVNIQINFYRHKSLRYFINKQNEIKDSIVYYSSPNFSKALGEQGELLVSNGLFRAGFTFISQHSNSYKNKIWTDTKHDFDFIVEKEGIGYAVEVKNTLGYIDKKELDILIEMAHYLELKPIFACRMLPEIWIIDISRNHGGFSWIFKHQLYPLNEANNAKLIKESLLLPVDTPSQLFDQTIQRLKNYHDRNIKNM